MNAIPVIIPAYEPDERMISLLHDIQKANIAPLIIVDDGSGEGYKELFDKAKHII